ncbi:MAG TPA: hypothetical protein VIT83_03295 [Gammaproteobacteria bacterium]
MFKALLHVSVWTSILLALTGFVPVVEGRHLTGYALLAHAGLGGLLAVTLAVLLLLTGQPHLPENEHGGSKVSTPRKWSYWLMTISALALILSVLVAMLPLLGTHGQHLAISAHRYAAVLFVLAGTGYLFLRKR